MERTNSKDGGGDEQTIAETIDDEDKNGTVENLHKSKEQFNQSMSNVTTATPSPCSLSTTLNNNNSNSNNSLDLKQQLKRQGSSLSISTSRCCSQSSNPVSQDDDGDKTDQNQVSRSGSKSENHSKEFDENNFDIDTDNTNKAKNERLMDSFRKRRCKISKMKRSRLLRIPMIKRNLPASFWKFNSRFSHHYHDYDHHYGNIFPFQSQQQLSLTNQLIESQNSIFTGVLEAGTDTHHSSSSSSIPSSAHCGSTSNENYVLDKTYHLTSQSQQQLTSVLTTTSYPQQQTNLHQQQSFRNHFIGTHGNGSVETAAPSSSITLGSNDSIHHHHHQHQQQQQHQNQYQSYYWNGHTNFKTVNYLDYDNQQQLPRSSAIRFKSDHDSNNHDDEIRISNPGQNYGSNSAKPLSLSVSMTICPPANTTPTTTATISKTSATASLASTSNDLTFDMSIHISPNITLATPIGTHSLSSNNQSQHLQHSHPSSSLLTFSPSTSTPADPSSSSSASLYHSQQYSSSNQHPHTSYLGLLQSSLNSDSYYYPTSSYQSVPNQSAINYNSQECSSTSTIPSTILYGSSGSMIDQNGSNPIMNYSQTNAHDSWRTNCHATNTSTPYPHYQRHSQRTHYKASFSQMMMAQMQPNQSASNSSSSFPKQMAQTSAQHQQQQHQHQSLYYGTDPGSSTNSYQSSTASNLYGSNLDSVGMMTETSGHCVHSNFSTQPHHHHSSLEQHQTDSIATNASIRSSPFSTTSFIAMAAAVRSYQEVFTNNVSSSNLAINRGLNNVESTSTSSILLASTTPTTTASTIAMTTVVTTPPTVL